LFDFIVCWKRRLKSARNWNVCVASRRSHFVKSDRNERVWRTLKENRSGFYRRLQRD
jgi:hypothetical protein